MYAKFLTLSLALSFVGCASVKPFKVTSNTPARIEMKGLEKCASTPCIVDVDVSFINRGRGNCGEGHSIFDRTLTAYPLDKRFSKESKTINSCTSKKGEHIPVYFDLEKRGGTNIDINNNINIENKN